MIRVLPQARARRRIAVAGVIAAWSALATADAAALARLLPWLPDQINTLAVGACVALTTLLAWAKHQAPVRAAFLDGMLFERQSASTVLLPALPRAVGDGGDVVAFNQPRHRRRPSPVREQH